MASNGVARGNGVAQDVRRGLHRPNPIAKMVTPAQGASCNVLNGGVYNFRRVVWPDEIAAPRLVPFREADCGSLYLQQSPRHDRLFNIAGGA